MRSPCPKCGIELFHKRLVWKETELFPGKQRRTTCCPSCGVPLETDRKARVIAFGALLLAGLSWFLVSDLLLPLIGSGWAAIGKGVVAVSACGLIVFSVVAFPYVTQERPVGDRLDDA